MNAIQSPIAALFGLCCLVVLLIITHLLIYYISGTECSALQFTKSGEKKMKWNDQSRCIIHTFGNLLGTPNISTVLRPLATSGSKAFLSVLTPYLDWPGILVISCTVSSSSLKIYN